MPCLIPKSIIVTNQNHLGSAAQMKDLYFSFRILKKGLFFLSDSLSSFLFRLFFFQFLISFSDSAMSLSSLILGSWDLSKELWRLKSFDNLVMLLQLPVLGLRLLTNIVLDWDSNDRTLIWFMSSFSAELTKYLFARSTWLLSLRGNFRTKIQLELTFSVFSSVLVLNWFAVLELAVFLLYSLRASVFSLSFSTWSLVSHLFQNEKPLNLTFRMGLCTVGQFWILTILDQMCLASSALFQAANPSPYLQFNLLASISLSSLSLCIASSSSTFLWCLGLGLWVEFSLLALETWRRASKSIY